MLGLVFALLVALSDALSHSLSHDHWQPFLETAKARGWTGRHTMRVTAAGALLHLLMGLGIGLFASLLIPLLIRWFGRIIPLAINVEVIIVALLYTMRALAALRHGTTLHRLEEAQDHCRGRHAARIFRGTVGPTQEVACGAVLGVSPCLEAVPLFIAASAYGLTRSLLTMLVWGLASILGLMSLVGLGYYHRFSAATGAKSKAFAWWERYGPLVTSTLLALLGLSGLLSSRI